MSQLFCGHISDHLYLHVWLLSRLQHESFKVRTTNSSCPCQRRTY